MPKLDRVIISTNEDSSYYDFWPYIAKAWQKLFNVKVSLAVVTDKTAGDPWITKLREFGEVSLFPTIKNIPTSSLALVSRHILATMYTDEVCMVNDIDLLPLNTSWYYDRLESRKPGQVLALGAEFFKGSVNEGKFPMGYITTEGRVWQQVINPRNLAYPDLIKSWIGISVFDKKEDISNTTYHEYKAAFCDESLMRLLLHRWGHPDMVIHRKWDFIPGVDSLDRGKWNFDLEKLKSGGYVEAHLLRPLSKHRDKLQPLFDYIDKL